MSSVFIKKNNEVMGTITSFPSSKSISNRVLIINALSGNKSVLHTISSSDDTQLMNDLLVSPKKIMDTKNAGTVMRFLTAYFAVTKKRKIMTGSIRMKQRPIGVLIKVLRTLGATITYHGKQGYPPFEMVHFDKKISSHITIQGNVSSQYISALMMIAPILPQGLTITLQGNVISRPYIDMTASLMNHFQATCSFTDNTIIIEPRAYTPSEITVEPDWSAVSYWLAFVALAKKTNIVLTNVPSMSIQGDRMITIMMEKLGVKTVFRNGQLVITKQEVSIEFMEQSFINCPDLAQTIIPVCALKGVKGLFTGMESLRIKETDRIVAMQMELKKIGARLTEIEKGVFQLLPSPQNNFPATIQIATYNDHRMAMGFAPWATQMDIIIENPTVVNKSYPSFWHHMKEVGFSIQEIRKKI